MTLGKDKGNLTPQRRRRKDDKGIHDIKGKGGTRAKWTRQIKWQGLEKTARCSERDDNSDHEREEAHVLPYLTWAKKKKDDTRETRRQRERRLVSEVQMTSRHSAAS